MTNTTLSQLNHILNPVERRTSKEKRLKQAYWAYRGLMVRCARQLEAHDAVWSRYNENNRTPVAPAYYVITPKHLVDELTRTTIGPVRSQRRKL